MSEYRRKTLRSFYCEEDLWKAFEKLSRDRDSTVDQLLNDALRAYLEGPKPEEAPAPSAAIPAPQGSA